MGTTKSLSKQYVNCGERATDLLSRLTLTEKAALMQNNSPAIPRLGIKAYEWWNEALHGVGRSGMATVFTQAIGMAASFNDALLFDVFTAVSDEARAKSNKFNANVAGKNSKWIVLPDLGRDEACMGIYPVTAPGETPQKAPRLEYKMFINQQGKSTFCIGILPSQDVNPERGLRIAVSIDNGEPQILDARKGLVDTFDEYTSINLENSKVLKPLPPLNRDIVLIGNGNLRRNEIFDNVRWLDVELNVNAPGFHTLKVFMIDPEVVIERIVVNPDNNHPSYFGPPSVQFNVKK